MSYELGFNTHGKGRVRLVKVTRQSNGYHEVQQLNVQILLEGYNMESVYTVGDNAKVIATDTCKNTVYCVAHSNKFESIEEFGLILCKHFLMEYPAIVSKVSVQIKQDKWERLLAESSKALTTSSSKILPHKHAFKRIGPQQRYTHVQGERRRDSTMIIKHDNDNNLAFCVQSGFHNLELLKTTQSGFVGFHRDRFTSLPDATDRLLGTSMDAEWAFSAAQISRGDINYNTVYDDVEQALVKEFTGPGDTGVYSASVQQTLFSMGTSALKTHSSLDKITLQMPNIHNMAFPLDKYGLENRDRAGEPFIFFPIDEPHGMIKAEVLRSRARL